MTQSKAQAFRWYTQSAEQGYVDAQYNLALMYYNGEGIRQNNDKAKEWFGIACDSGNLTSCKEYKNLD